MGFLVHFIHSTDIGAQMNIFNFTVVNKIPIYYSLNPKIANIRKDTKQTHTC